MNKPSSINACPCCVDAQEVCTLLETPLRQLKAEQLGGYASSVFLTAGSETDFRYFLPRILEISAAERHWWPDREVVLEKLSLAHWENWAKQERDCLINYFEAAFEHSLVASEDVEYDVDAWICGLALAHVDVGPFLRRLEELQFREALFKYAELNLKAFTDGQLWNAFWGKHDREAEPVLTWLTSSPQVKAALTERGVPT